MKRIVTAMSIVAMTLAAGSAFASPRKGDASRAYAGPTQDVVCVGLNWAYARVLGGGRDPDPFIRNSLLREYAPAGVFPGRARADATHCEGYR